MIWNYQKLNILLLTCLQCFQKIVRDLSNLSDRLEIKSVGNELILNNGPFASVHYDVLNAMVIWSLYKNKKMIKLSRGISLKNLSYFIKCKSM